MRGGGDGLPLLRGITAQTLAGDRRRGAGARVRRARPLPAPARRARCASATASRRTSPTARVTRPRLRGASSTRFSAGEFPVLCLGPVGQRGPQPPERLGASCHLDLPWLPDRPRAARRARRPPRRRARLGADLHPLHPRRRHRARRLASSPRAAPSTTRSSTPSRASRASESTIATQLGADHRPGRRQQGRGRLRRDRRAAARRRRRLRRLTAPAAARHRRAAPSTTTKGGAHGLAIAAARQQIDDVAADGDLAADPPPPTSASSSTPSPSPIVLPDGKRIYPPRAARRADRRARLRAAGHAGPRPLDASCAWSARPATGKSQIARAIAYRLWTDRGRAVENRHGAPFYGFVEMQPAARPRTSSSSATSTSPIAEHRRRGPARRLRVRQAMRDGWVVMIDEVNTVRDVALLSINATLDGRLALYLPATGETVIAQPGLRGHPRLQPRPGRRDRHPRRLALALPRHRSRSPATGPALAQARRPAGARRARPPRWTASASPARTGWSGRRSSATSSRCGR